MAWRCSGCTFENVDARSICEICHSDRLVGFPPSPPTSSSSAKWACSACTFENAPLADTCAICTAKKPLPTPPPPEDPPPVSMDVEPSLENIRNLQNLGGFSEEHVIHALSVNEQSVSRAAEWLLLNPEHVETDDVEMEVEKPSPTDEIDQKEVEESLREALAKEEQRLERERLRKLRKKEEIAKDLEERKKEAVQRKRLDENKRQKERIELAKQRAEHDLKNHQHNVCADEQRLREENAIPDISSAVKRLKERYGMNGMQETLSIIAKLVQNVLDHPNEEKYRCLSASSAMFRNRLRGRLGGLAILRCLGFERKFEQHEETDEHHEIYVLTDVNTSLLQTELQKLMKVVNLRESKVPRLLAQSNGNEETLLFLAMSLKVFMENAIVAPTSTLARRIDTRSDAYRGFMENVPEATSILEAVGYELKSPFWVVQQAAVANFPKVVRDLAKEVAQRSRCTAIAQELLKLKQQNSWSKTEALVETILSALDKVIADMHSTNLHLIRLSQLRKKTGTIAGLPDFVKSLGLKVEDSSSVRVPYPHEFGVEPYRLRVEVLRRAWKRLLATKPR